MKKLLPLIALLFQCVFVLAQINTAVLPAIGDTIIYQSQNSNIQATPGGNGSGQVWDFSTFFGLNTDSIYYLDASSSPFSASFPTATFWRSEGVDNEQLLSSTFYVSDGTTIDEVGEIGIPESGVLVPFKYATPLTWMVLPSSLGTTFIDSTIVSAQIAGAEVGFPFDSVRVIRYLVRFDTISASGSLALASDFFPNVLRKTTQDFRIDSMFSYTNGNGWSFMNVENRVTTHYSWIGPNEPYILADLIYVDGQPRSFRALSFDAGLATNYLEYGTVSATTFRNQPLPTFNVTVRSIATGQVVTNYNQDIQLAGYSLSGPQMATPVNGVATFANVSFFEAGTWDMITYAPSCLFDTATVHVIQVPDSLVFNVPNPTVEQGQTMDAFEVLAYNTGGQFNTEYPLNVHIGRKSGPSGISGTTSRPFVNGVATFDDIHFDTDGPHELVAFFRDVLYTDTVSINVTPTPGQWVFSHLDTLNEYVERAGFFIWWGGAQGFASGPSRIPIWDELGQQFDFNGSGRIVEIQIHAANLVHAGVEPDSFTVRVYTAGVNEIMRTNQGGNNTDKIYVDSLAKHLLAEVYFPEDSVTGVSQFFIPHPIHVPIPEPIEVHGPFVVTLQVNYEGGVDDTLLIWHGEIGNGMGEGRASRRVINNPMYADGTWLPETIAQAFSVTDYDFMIAPVLEIDEFQLFVGVEDEARHRIQLYPNPANDRINILLPQTPKDLSLVFYDAQGRAVLNNPRVSETSTGISVDVNGLVPGCYLVNLRNEESSYHGRFVKQ